MINYRFNEWAVSGEQSEAISEKGQDLLRIDNGRVTGEQLGKVLYMYYVEGKSFNVINRTFREMSYFHVRGILSGTFSPVAFNLFMELLEEKPEELNRLFGGADSG
ncbi:hypothetical protein K8O68_13590 [Salipaludibacillus sp. CUR1]|uniref:hypothetical protein n=1 Tax=Salipaludibacillus sp. CUR1 TaxID=2820003 RepID=UPI001E2E3133|nr:hypothetical protein [Salipaludibacillus sp. CUR1]MCE7793453.1 hypothetical protein [Salipaludibacillus sp. CUR1]